MNKKVLRVLEYDKIISMLTERAGSEPGKRLCRELAPMTDLSALEEAQANTADALSRLFRKGSTSFGGNLDLGMSLRSLEIGSILSIPELLKIAGLLENTARTKSYGRAERDDTAADTLTALFDGLEPLTPLSSEIRRCLLSEEEVADDASPELKRVRRQMRLVNDRIHSHLAGMVNGSCRAYLQEAVITLRDNRYCLPVKAEYKGQVPGMIHDQSSTGSTLFIEPSAVVSLNNELKQLELAEKKEIEAVLAALSVLAAEHTAPIQENSRLMGLLDFIFAKASLAMDMNASRPVFNRQKRLHIRKGRHPLLDKKRVVPIDIRLGEDFDLLVITGPNTGGKTVSLKTAGLLTLMGQAGLHIPAADRSELAVFTEVFADIGDEQSIEQNLSTFSSHMTTIVTILAQADENSLCLFDELGAGTDPTEGAALAIAILDRLHRNGIRTMATTHYSELKVYALSTPAVENACCEFSVETLQPTYRLLIGIPGKSNAFAISSKLGLPDDIIETARGQISEENTNFEDLLADLEQNRVTIEKEQLEIQSYKEEIQKLKEQLQSKQEKIDQTRDRILREANEKARDILQEAKDVADETIRVFQKAGPNASIRDLEKARHKVRGEIGKKNERLTVGQQPPAESGLKPGDLKLGDAVRVLSMGLKGTVHTLPDQRGNLSVQCGIMRTQVNLKDLILIDEDKKGPGRQTGGGSGGLKTAKAMTITPELNLLGKTVDEALAELDKYLDDAYLAHLPSVRIVHGKGTGALRQAVQNHLRRVKYIKSYRLGEYGEGDAGVTIAEFK